VTLNPATRVNYFERQFIRLNELRDEQAYHVDLRRRHNLSHHSWGIVLGLEIVLEQDGRPAVRPGFAVDGYGRELFLLERRVVGREEFARYGTSRLDLWLEYRLDLAEERLAPRECGDGDPRWPYRAKEWAEVTFERGGAQPDPRRHPSVPVEALEEPLLATPDAPRQRWPVYLGRIIMEVSASGSPTFTIDADDRVYAGLNAEIIDHPGSPARLELGARPPDPETRTIGDETFTYSAGSKRDFAVFVPPPSDSTALTLEPTIAVDQDGTQIMGTAKVHGNLILDGAVLQFPDIANAQNPDTAGQPSLYRTADELRIDLGSLSVAGRRLVLGVTKDGNFLPALEIGTSGTTTTHFVVTVKGDLRIEGNISSPDVRTRTVTEEVAALLTGMVQAGMAAGGP
jgi:hypothetical protein